MSAFATISPIALGTVTGGAGRPGTGTTSAPVQQQPQPENIGNDAINGALSGLANSFGSGGTGSLNGNAIFQDILGGLLGAAQGALGGLAKKNGVGAAK